MGVYLLLEELGAGSSGTAHLAIRAGERSGALYVIKQLNAEIAASELTLKRFRHEATIAVMVDHPNVVEVVDVVLGGERPYLVMKYVDGPTLAELIAAMQTHQRTLSPHAVVGLIREALSGLDALHNAKHPDTGEPLGFVHRDLSPRNLIATRRGHIRLIDLGLGRSRLQDWETTAGTVMGSLGYMPPEQLRGQELDRRADLWSLASVLFELLTLEPYIVGRGRDRVMNTLEATPRSLRKIRSDIPVALDEVVSRGLSSTPAARFESAASFSRALEEACPGESWDEAQELLESLFSESLDERMHRIREVALTVVEPQPMAIEFERIASRPGEETASEFATVDITKLVADPIRAKPTRRVAPPSVPARARWPRLLGLALVTATAAAVTVFVLQPAEEPVVAHRRTESPPKPTASAVPGVTPRERTMMPPPLPEPTPATAPDAGTTARRIRRRVINRATPPAAPKRATPAQRAAVLQSKLQSMRANKIAGAQQLLVDLTALDLVTDPARYAAALARIERRAAALEP